MTSHKHWIVRRFIVSPTTHCFFCFSFYTGSGPKVVVARPKVALNDRRTVTQFGTKNSGRNARTHCDVAGSTLSKTVRPSDRHISTIASGNGTWW